MPRINIGDKFPELTVDTAYARDVALYDLFSDKTVIWCLRYIGCPPCHLDLHVAIERYNEVTAKGGKIIFVMQSDQPHITMHYPEGSIPLDIICDPEQKLYKALEILPAKSMEELLGSNMDKLKAKGKKAEEYGYRHGDFEGDEQQLPAMFMVDKNGIVSFAKYAENITDLPDLDEVLAML